MVENEEAVTLDANQENAQQQFEEKLIVLKREMAWAKTNFTKYRRSLLVLIQSEEAQLKEI